MAGQARPLDSGRKDVLGRTVRVSDDAAGGRADAPPPPGDGQVNEVLLGLLNDRLVEAHDDDLGDGEGREVADRLIRELVESGRATDETVGALIAGHDVRGACKAIAAGVPLDVYQAHGQVEHLATIYRDGLQDPFVASGLSPYQFKQAVSVGLSQEQMVEVAGLDWQQRSGYFRDVEAGEPHEDALRWQSARLTQRTRSAVKAMGLDLSSVLSAQAAGRLEKVTEAWSAGRFDESDDPEFVDTVVDEIVARSRFLMSQNRRPEIVSGFVKLRRAGVSADEFDAFRKGFPANLGEIRQRHLDAYVDAKQVGLGAEHAAMFASQSRVSLQELRRYRVTDEEIVDLAGVDGFGPEHFGKYAFWRDTTPPRRQGRGRSASRIGGGPRKSHREAKMQVEISIAEDRAAEAVRARYAADDES